MMIITADSHLDHGLNVEHLECILKSFVERDAFFIETIDIPPHMDSLLCRLRGPAVGDPPISDADCSIDESRAGRAWISRLCRLSNIPTRKLTVIAGPHRDYSCMLYTAFGGPLAPKEPGEIRAELADLERRVAVESRPFTTESIQRELHVKQIDALRVKLDESVAFWREHALSR